MLPPRAPDGVGIDQQPLLAGEPDADVKPWNIFARQPF
jgi:hypothetical protein